MRRGAWQVGWLVALLAIMLGVVSVAVAQSPTESGREEVEIVAEQDAYIASGQPDTNFGGSDALFIGYVIGAEEYGATRTLLWFDVASALPENATVERARLILYLTYAEPPGDELMETRVRRLDSAWGEFAVTWNSEPTWDATFEPVMADVGSDQGPYEWDLTEMVRSWVTGEHPNYGLLLQGDETPELARERVFFSRDAMVGDELKPRLIVEYVVDEVPPVVTVNPLPAYSPPHFLVSWSGDDEGSGIAYYDVQYRMDGGEWTLWQSGVTDTEATFTGLEGHLYEFEARGVDLAGNVEPFTGEPEAATRTVLVEGSRLWLPIVLNATAGE